MEAAIVLKTKKNVVLLAFGSYPGYSTSLCTSLYCYSETEETCYDESSNAYCAAGADGGCSCPEGEEECGATDGYAGYCTSLCCTSETEETCYEENNDPESCVNIADGGCPSSLKSYHSEIGHNRALSQKEIRGKVTLLHAMEIKQHKQLRAARLTPNSSIKRMAQKEKADFFRAMK